MNNKTNQKHSIHISKKLDKYLNIEGKKFVINDLENYCCFWIYNKDQFHKFLKSKWWSFKKELIILDIIMVLQRDHQLVFILLI